MSNTEATAPRFISIKAASQRLGMSIDEVYELVKSGELAHLQRSKHAKIHILSADLDEWVMANVKKASA